MWITQSTGPHEMVFMTDSADHVTGKTGLTLTITASKNGGAFASISPTVTERGSGWYDLALTSSHTDTAGPLAIHITATGADAADLNRQVVSLNDQAFGVNVYGFGGSAGTFASGRPEVNLSHIAGSAVNTNNAQIGVNVVSIASSAALSVWAAATSSLTTAGSIGKYILDNWTSARAGYLDNLNVGGLVASASNITAITMSQQVRVLPPAMMERPDSSSLNYRIWIYTYNEQNAAEDLDSLPTVTVENNTGTDRSSNLGSVTKVALTTGQYYVDYNVPSGHEIEGLVIKAICTENSVATVYAAASIVVDTTAVDYTAADRIRDDAMSTYIGTLYNTRIPGVIQPQTGDAYARLGAPAGASVSADIAAIKTDTGNLVTRITSTLFSGITSLAKWLRLYGSKEAGDATALSEMRNGTGTYDPTTDSLEAIVDTGLGGGDVTVGAFGESALQQLLNGVVQVVQPLGPNAQVEIVRGMDYSATHDRSLNWTDTKGQWPVLTDATITVIAWKKDGKVVKTFSGAVVTPTGDTKQVKLELTAAQTNGFKMGEWVYGVYATLSDTTKAELLRPVHRWSVLEFPA